MKPASYRETNRYRMGTPPPALRARSGVRAAAAAAVSVLALAGCAVTPPGTDAGPTPSVAAADEGTYNAADLHFAQSMPPHHDQAIEMSKILLDKPGVHPDVKAVAKRIRKSHQAQLDAMYTWTWAQDRPTHDEGEEDDGGAHHNGQDGLMTEYQMMQLDLADRATVQILFLDGMIRHHQGALALAQAETREGKNRDVVDFAAAIVINHQAEIDTLVGLRARI